MRFKKIFQISGILMAIAALTILGIAVDQARLAAASETVETTMVQPTAASTPGTHSHAMLNTDSSQPLPGVSIKLHPDAASGYNLQLVTENFTFSPENTNLENVNSQGHAHLYINGEKIKRMYGNWEHLPASLFAEGENSVKVTLNANDHSNWAIDGMMIMDEVTISDTGTVTQAPSTGQITYYLDWDWGQATSNASGQGWAVTNDLGYDIQVTNGYLVNRTIQLVACEHNHTASMSSALLNVILPQTALAGHGDTERDASQINTPFVESLATPMLLEVETVTGDEPAYCKTHYLLAPGIETATNLPVNTDMVGTTLLIEGQYKASGNNSFEPFTISTNLAWGTNANLDTLHNSGNTNVVISRRLDTLFDNVDFDQMSTAEQAQAVLRSITNSTEVTSSKVTE